MVETGACDIAIIGGGPAGLILAYALQRALPDAVVKVDLSYNTVSSLLHGLIDSV